MVRDKFYKEILVTLDNHPRFDSSDFKIQSTKVQNGVNLVIRFLNVNNFNFFIKIPNSITVEKHNGRLFYEFSGTACPGPMAHKESFTFLGEESDITDRIWKWLECIWEDLSAKSVIKQVEANQQKVGKVFERLDEFNDDGFAENEKAGLLKRLDALEAALLTQIQKNTDDEKEYIQQVKKLKIEIETLKLTINSYTKKGWLKSFLSKMLNWTNAYGSQLLFDGYKVIKNFIPEHIDPTLHG